jgi:hypothetical protein
MRHLLIFDGRIFAPAEDHQCKRGKEGGNGVIPMDGE